MSEPFYYVVWEGNFWEIRQLRYRHLVEEPPHDRCCLATSLQEMAFVWHQGFYLTNGGIDLSNLTDDEVAVWVGKKESA